MRRSLILVVALAICVPLAAQETQPKPNERPDPEAMWKALQTGNLKFKAGEISYTDLDDERTKLANGQIPPITILACSDSRVAPELAFNQSLGALFVIRTAGNVTDDFGLASIEYAIKNRWTSLIVVLGHESCGAVEAALNPTIDDALTPSLLHLVQRIRESFNGGPYLPDDKKVVLKATEANARASAAWLMAHSSVVRDAVINGWKTADGKTMKLKIVPAYQSLTTGAVREIE
jgi:carbonic anhydrase